MNAHTTIIITGATGGIGAALVAEYAAPGVTMLLIGRDTNRLAEVAAKAMSAGAQVQTAPVDSRDADAMADCVRAFDDLTPVDLLIANAGASSGVAANGDEPEARRMIEVNLLGAMNTVLPLIPRMTGRGRGRIALVSSLAALRPHGDMPAYSASKAGLRAWGISLRGALRPHGVGVTVICPGFVTSPMSARHQGAKPFEISAARAAIIIRRGLARRAPLITFPWPLLVLVRLGNLLPPRLADWFERGFAARIEPDDDTSVNR